MPQLITFLTENGLDILQALASIIAGAAVLANFTKTDKDNKAIGLVSKLINLLAANFTSGKLK